MRVMAGLKKRYSDARRAWDNRDALAAQMGAEGIVATVIGFIVVMYVIAYTYDPLEGAATELENQMGNASITGVQNINNLPDVAVLLFILLVILGLIMAVVRSERL